LEDPRGLFLINYEQLGCTKNSPPRDAAPEKIDAAEPSAHTRVFDLTVEGRSRINKGCCLQTKKMSYNEMSQSYIRFYFLCSY
jgi:hypothetical protein